MSAIVASGAGVPSAATGAHWSETVAAFLAKAQSRPLVVACFLGLSIIYGWIAFGHVYWRDEAMPLLIARHYPGFVEFIRAMRYEGTPAGWHLLLWGVSKVAPLTPFTASLVHFVFVEAFLALVLFALPVSLSYRMAIAMAQPVIWNAFNARQYQVAAVCLIAFAPLFLGQSRHRSWGLSVTLAVLMQTCLHAVVAALGLFAYWAISDWQAKRKCWHPGYGLVALSLVLAGLQLVSPADLMPGLRTMDLHFVAGKAIGIAFTLIEVCLLNQLWSIVAMATLGGVIFYHAFQTKRFQAVLAAACLGATFFGFFVITYLKMSGERHMWLFTFTLISVLVTLHQPRGKGTAASLALAGMILLCSVLSFSRLMPAIGFILKSHSRNVAEYLDREFPTKTVLSASETFEAPVRLYRKTHPPEFALGRGAFVNYTVWNHRSVDFVNNPACETIHLAAVREDILRVDRTILDADPIVVLSGFKIVDDLPPGNRQLIELGDGYRLKFLRLLTSAAEENYAIFQLEHSPRS